MASNFCRKCLLFALSITFNSIPTSVAREKSKGKILLFPGDHGSHVNFFSVLGKSLADFGYETYILATVQYAKMAEDHGLIHLYSTNVTEKSFDLVKFVMSGTGTSLPAQIYSTLVHAGDWVIPPAKQLYSDTNFLQRIEELNFDMVIIDGFEFYRLNFILPYKLNLRYISVNHKPDPWHFHVPSMPSVENQIYYSYMTKDSTIFDRMVSLLATAVAHFLVPEIAPATKSLMAELAPEIQPVSPDELYWKSELVLVNMDTICLERPRVQSSNFIYTGGLGAKKAMPLSEKYLKFIAQFPEGIILMSFGSGIKALPKDKMTTFLEVFRQLKLGVIMRYDGDTNDLVIPSNVMLSKWLPQNDIIGHPNTRLFITHAGNNGQLEAVFHGVPMLSMPLFGDQRYNAIRSEMRGYGLTVHYGDLTTSELLSTIKEILSNSSYKENIKRCSKILQALPTAQDNAVFWIDHIIRFGSDHLRPYYPNMPLWRFFMLDIVALTATVVIVMFFALIVFCKCSYKMFCNKSYGVKVSKKKKET